MKMLGKFELITRAVGGGLVARSGTGVAAAGAEPRLTLSLGPFVELVSASAAQQVIGNKQKTMGSARMQMDFFMAALSRYSTFLS
jgi:hypothetical protein